MSGIEQVFDKLNQGPLRGTLTLGGNEILKGPYIVVAYTEFDNSYDILWHDWGGKLGDVFKISDYNWGDLDTLTLEQTLDSIIVDPKIIRMEVEL